ncbi:MAG TPA: adenylate/guanylate cyclase domain-containing protein [Actinomycetota bacterium]|nr:adenylate/guanylate cyclase domain-containing protein [Actinomycetota bacterium]
MNPPQTNYAKSGDVHIAYQVAGDGPLDLVYVPGFVSNVEEVWEEPHAKKFLERLASFSRLILFDKRGTGLSDPVPIADLPTLEQRMDDLRAVMDAAGSERAALLGHSEGGVMSVLFAATYPDRTVALITLGTFAKRVWSADYPWAPTPEERALDYTEIERSWGREIDLDVYAPSMVGDRAFALWFAGYFRRSASPQAAIALLKMNTQADIRHVLPAVRVPTLVMNRVGDLDVNVEEARYIAARIPGAKLVELSGADHTMWVGETGPLLDEIEEFLTGVRRGPDPDRVLATLLFTDIVGSTERAAALGDRAWSELIERHHALVRSNLARYRGREVDTAGDGFLATFDGPARAVRCAAASVDAVRDLGLEIRAGVHTGEVEMAGEKVRGVAVHIGARVASLATAGEVLVSNTVKDLVAGSGIEFAERGRHELKGVSGQWQLYAVAEV